MSISICFCLYLAHNICSSPCQSSECLQENHPSPQLTETQMSNQIMLGITFMLTVFISIIVFALFLSRFCWFLYVRTNSTAAVLHTAFHIGKVAVFSACVLTVLTWIILFPHHHSIQPIFVSEVNYQKQQLNWEWAVALWPLCLIERKCDCQNLGSFDLKLSLSLHCAFWRFTEYYTPTNAQIIYYILV